MIGVFTTMGVLVLLVAWLVYFSVATVPGKAMAVAQAAYREAIRQPLFWFLTIFALLFMFLATLMPYFTFGEELKMMKDLQLDAILLPTLILAIITAAISISEEIEGRTATTLLSKPVSRRQFLVGKFVGMIMAVLLMTVILSVFMGWTINYKITYDVLDDLAGRPQDVKAIKDAVTALPAVLVQPVEYTLLVFASLKAMAAGPILIFCQIMVLTAIAVALATRLPLVVNLITCLAVFFFGRLTHVLEIQAGDNTLVKFVAGVFKFLLPGFNYYDVGPTLSSNVVEVPFSYVFHAGTHAVIYTVIAMLFGLILFEDRDLA